MAGTSSETTHGNGEGPSTSAVKNDSVPELGFVLRGGGVKGLAMLGAIAELERTLNIKGTAFAGTSAGGMLAIALASGYTATQLIPVVRNQSFLDFLSSEWAPDPYSEPWLEQPPKPRRFLPALITAGLLRVGIGCLGLRTRGGMFSSEPIGRWMLHLLRWRPYRGSLPSEPDLQTDTRLGALSLNVLTIAASTGPKNRVTHSNVNTPELDACLAARCTMSIPGIFHPVPFGGDLLLDGGLVANFPIEDFLELWPRTRMIGVFLCDAESSAKQRDRTTSPVGILKASLAIFLGQDELVVSKEKKESILWVDVTPIHTVDFDLSNEDKDFLLECGRVGALRWLRENADDPIVISGAVPSDHDFTERAAQLRVMRSAARSRWKARHRYRRLLLTIAFLMPLLLILVGILAGGFALSRLAQAKTGAMSQRVYGAGSRVLNVAVVLNGEADYCMTASRAFQNALESGLRGTEYVARVEIATGHPEINSDAGNEDTFRELLGRFESKPDYLISIGTQVSIFARQHFLGKIPLIFDAVTDPVDAGLVKDFRPDGSRGNFGGVAYGDIETGVRFLHAVFPSARLGFYYSSRIRQDAKLAKVLASCCPEVTLLDDLGNPLGSAQTTNVDILFGWYFLNNNFLTIHTRFSGGIVAGNQADMTRGAVAMIASNDEEVGSLAVTRVLLPNLLTGRSLADEPIFQANMHQFAVNKTIARHQGLSLAPSLPSGTTEFE